MPDQTKQCPSCDTNNERIRRLCSVCGEQLPDSRVRGVRCSRVRKSRDLQNP